MEQINVYVKTKTKIAEQPLTLIMIFKQLVGQIGNIENGLTLLQPHQ